MFPPGPVLGETVTPGGGGRGSFSTKSRTNVPPLPGTTNGPIVFGAAIDVAGGNAVPCIAFPGETSVAVYSPVAPDVAKLQSDPLQICTLAFANGLPLTLR